MAKSIWPLVAQWQGSHHVINATAIQGPGNRRTLIWETDAQNGIAVIEKVGDGKRGHFVDIKIIDDKPFKSVVAKVKRAYTLARKKAEVQLC